MTIYAQINKDGYCYGIIQAGGSGTYENMIPVPQYDLSYIGKKYNYEEQIWIDEYAKEEVPEPEPQPTAEELERAEILLTLQEVLINQQGGKTE